MVASIAGSIPGRVRAPKNAWYVVAFSDEVSATPLARRILGERCVLYRTEVGAPVMLADRCAHRAMALSQGKRVCGDRLQCPYHGLEYDASGVCVRIPSQPQIPKQMRVRSYPLAEKWKWVWAWTGDPNLADESLIPDHRLFGLAEDDAFHKAARFLMNIEGSYQFLQENLLDVSHITFLHEGSFDSGVIAETPAETKIDGNVIRISRKTNEIASGGFARAFGLPEGARLERELVSTTWVPNLDVVSNYFRLLDEPEKGVLCRHSPFAITPESDTTCHYFTASASNYGTALEGDALAASNTFVWEVFLTDKAAIESIQQSYMELGSETPDVSVRADEAALRFRRILEQQLLSEESSQ